MRYTGQGYLKKARKKIDTQKKNKMRWEVFLKVLNLETVLFEWVPMVLSFCEGNPVALTKLSVALSFAQLAQEKV